MNEEERNAELEICRFVAQHITQIKNRALALKAALEAEKDEPQAGDNPGSIAVAIEQATEYAEALEGHYHPSSYKYPKEEPKEPAPAKEPSVVEAHRAQADALLIESAAKRKLADKYDAAQERGEIAKRGGQDRVRDNVPDGNIILSTTADVGLTSKQVHEASKLRDAEVIESGITEKTSQGAFRYAGKD